MKKIDIVEWKEYKLCGDDGLFECFGSKTTPRLQLEQKGEGVYPYVTTQATDNGIAGYYNLYTEFGNVLTVDSAVLGTCFYQPQNFSASDHVEILKPKFTMTKYIALFLSTVINKNGQFFGYAYNLKRSQTALKQEKITLPSKLNMNGEYEPDWQYMEEYIKSIEKKVQFSSVQFSLSSKTEKENVDCQKWKEFKIDDLFHNKFVKPEVWHTRELVEDNAGISYVVRTKFNNGIKCNVLKTEKMSPSPAGTISFGAENATFFYQEKEYVSGRDIYYIDTTNLPTNTCLFLVGCLQKITDKYSYNYGMFPDLVKEETIKLPVDENGNPDWNYMENYITQIETRAHSRINYLKQATE